MMTRSEALVDLAKRNLAMTRQLAAQGLLTVSDIFDARRELYKAERSLSGEPRTSG